jgi:aminomethyltransferase
VSAASPPEPVFSPLHGVHQRLGARFTEYAGWRLPLRYAGTLAEHRAVRSSAGVFDLSHVGRFECSGSGATETLRWLLCNDVALASPGSTQYTMMLTFEGGVVSDLDVWRWSHDRYWVLPSSVNHNRVMKEVAAGSSVEVSDRRAQTAMIAVQGPEAPQVVALVLGAAPPRSGLLESEYEGFPVWAAGTGGTGEPGARIAIDTEAAPGLFESVIEAGAVPCGLAACDVLQLEMGSPLWGDDLDTSTTPIEAALEQVVEWEHDFVGRRALAAQRRSGAPKRRIGFVTGERSVPRPGYLVRCGPATGFVARGTFSPVLGAGIGIAYVSPDPGNSTDVTVDIRGRRIDASRVDLPFVRL